MNIEAIRMLARSKGAKLASKFYRVSLESIQSLSRTSSCPAYVNLLKNAYCRPVESLSNGLYCLLPMGFRVQSKLCRALSELFEKIDAVRIEMPLLSPLELFARSGRLDSKDFSSILMTVDSNFALNPTHEECISSIIKQDLSSGISTNNFPIFMYQIGKKFRNENRPKHLLMRSKEFTMLDAYSFHLSEKCSADHFDMVKSYISEFLIKVLNLKHYVVSQKSDEFMNSIESCEFHARNNGAGENNLVVCQKYENGKKSNVSLDSRSTSPICHCGTHDLEHIQTSEVAHIFRLGSRYSSCFDLDFPTKGPLKMNCYGVGISRLLTVMLTGSVNDNLKWPSSLVPFNSVIVAPKEGSHEETQCLSFIRDLLSCSSNLKDILIDDRVTKTIGMRLRDLRTSGIPFGIVCGREVPSSCQCEFHDFYSESYENRKEREMLKFNEILKRIDLR